MTENQEMDDEVEHLIRVLLAEDEESFIEALEIGLAREGFSLTIARDGLSALEQFRSGTFELVLLDVMLPKMSGLDVCRAIRTTSNIPIIMVTAKAAEIDTVVGLEVGADDYVAKPYRLRELISRMRAVLRRVPANVTSAPTPSTDEVRTPQESETPTTILTSGDIELDLDRHECLVRGQEVQLPLKEFELLEQLLSSAGRVVTREALIDRVWGYDYVGDTKTLDVHIKRLRSRVEVDPSKPTLITTIRGLGYRLEAGRRS
jgi:two-component system response regulator RegX3